MNVKQRTWSDQLLSALELDRSLFAECVESEDVTGKLTSEAAKALGLSTDCIVVGGAGDCAAGAIGNGIVKQGVVSTSLGTSGVVFFHSETPEVDPNGRLHTFCHAVRGKWHMMGVTLSAAGSLQWFRNALCQELAAAAKKSKRDIYDLLTEEAADVAAGSQGLFFLPYLSGERTPHADPDARGSFVGLTMSHTRGAMVRAILEGVTFSLNESVQIVRSLGVPIDEIRATGGGARSPLWRQIQADVFGQKVVTTQAEEGPAYGVALLAAVGAGAFKDIQEACKAVVKTGGATKPKSKASQAYAERFPVYQGLYQSLSGDFKKIAELER